MAKKTEPTLLDLLNSAAEILVTSADKPNILMYKPHPKQEEFHCGLSREKLFIGGNRSGKTVANVTECIWWLTKKHPHRKDVNNIIGPVRGRLVSVSFIDGVEKIILPLFKQFLPPSELIDGSWEKSYSAFHRTLTLKNGSFIEFMSYDQEIEKFAGTSRHFVSFDEEPPLEVFVECRMRLIDTKGSWWISMTPLLGLTWIYKEIVKPHKAGNRPETQIIEIETTENPYIAAEEVDAALSIGLSEADKIARRKGRFDANVNRVLPDFNEHVHQISSFNITKDMLIYTSYDHGWRHPAAWLWHAVKPDGHVITFHEMISGGMTIADMAAYVHKFEAENGIKVFMRAADPAVKQTSSLGGMSILSEYAMKHQIYFAVDSIPKGPGSVAIGLDKMQQYLRIDEDQRIPFWQYYNCPILSGQMETLQWESWSSKKQEYKNGVKDKIHKVNDDGPDSLRYFMTLLPDLWVKVGDQEFKMPRTQIGNMRAATYQPDYAEPLPESSPASYDNYINQLEEF